MNMLLITLCLAALALMFIMAKRDNDKQPKKNGLRYVYEGLLYKDGVWCNPATGLPMIDDKMDSGGNAYGPSSNSHSPT
ncbi:MAG: hypothetical protein PHO27_12640 [Sulfuricurvum sp.]|nr:hypothetical protein [Sulfuricurvum sp.]